MRKPTTTLVFISSLIIILVIIAAGLGVFWQGEGEAFAFQSLRGETIMMQGHGLYYYETVSTAAQAIAQDAVTLILGVPLLIIALVLSLKGSLRGQLLLSGTLAYFLYTYASFVFGAAYNVLFLLYVALFSLSLFAFILSIMAIDVSGLAVQFSPKLPRRAIAVFMFAVGLFLIMAWLGRIVPALVNNRPPLGLESSTTLVIQALDLGLVIPLAILAGILLWRRRPWGYMLTAIVLIKGFTLAMAVSAMAVNMMLAGVHVAIGEMVMFPTLALVDIGMMVIFLKNVESA
ncbi:MAG TPA: hypothetical protein PLP19_14780 [bacterium]|nr:hypothetical protein [bacterium]HPN44755.1 hypothetical protein [bacterium]